MLSKLILVLLQVVVAWGAGPIVRGQIPAGGGFDIFLYAVIFAILIYLTGVLGAQVLRETSTPSSATLTSCLILALIAAAVVAFIPQFIPDLPNTTISNRGIVLAAAMLGYWIKR